MNADLRAVLRELRDEIAGYAPEDDGYILLRPSKTWRIHDALLTALEQLAAAIEENERATELWGAAKKIKRAFGLWLPRTENTNVPKEMTDALEALFAILAKEKPK